MPFTPPASHLAQSGEIGGFEQGTDLRHPQYRTGRKRARLERRFSPLSLWASPELRGSTFGFAVQGVGGGEPGANLRMRRSVVAGPFKPDDVCARLQQVHQPDPLIEFADPVIARTEADGSLYKRDCLL